MDNKEFMNTAAQPQPATQQVEEPKKEYINNVIYVDFIKRCRIAA